MSNTGDFGLDGTQDPPPPRLFPDPLGGLVTGETYAPPKPVPPLVLPLPAPPDPEIARQAIRAAFAQEQRPRQRRQSAPVPQTRGYSARPQQYRAPVVKGPAAVAPAAAPPQAAAKRGSAFMGCLIGLLIAGSALFSVLREVFEAVLDMFR